MCQDVQSCFASSPGDPDAALQACRAWKGWHDVVLSFCSDTAQLVNACLTSISVWKSLKKMVELMQYCLWLNSSFLNNTNYNANPPWPLYQKVMPSWHAQARRLTSIMHCICKLLSIPNVNCKKSTLSFDKTSLDYLSTHAAGIWILQAFDIVYILCDEQPDHAE